IESLEESIIEKNLLRCNENIAEFVTDEFIGHDFVSDGYKFSPMLFDYLTDELPGGQDRGWEILADSILEKQGILDSSIELLMRQTGVLENILSL
ncbi:hypothetical protein AB9F43_32780, partial [Rhizobium leguminosarum]|uniref:hypothetical protein n=1 Tax=Rhizobium leguminosarum TaxID=384 RepID=UPI003F97CC0A